MHLLIIILQQLLGLLPNGEGKKAPQVELARVPRPKSRGAAPRNSDPGAFLGVESRRRDWMTRYWKSGPHRIDCSNLADSGLLWINDSWMNDRAPRVQGRRLSGTSAVEWVYAQFKRRLRPAPRTGRPPAAADPDVGA
jgi:hypothetical protein